jgi:hypothetical protein
MWYGGAIFSNMNWEIQLDIRSAINTLSICIYISSLILLVTCMAFTILYRKQNRRTLLFANSALLYSVCIAAISMELGLKIVHISNFFQLAYLILLWSTITCLLLYALEAMKPFWPLKTIALKRRLFYLQICSLCTGLVWIPVACIYVIVDNPKIQKGCYSTFSALGAIIAVAVVFATIYLFYLVSSFSFKERYEESLKSLIRQKFTAARNFTIYFLVVSIIFLALNAVKPLFIDSERHGPGVIYVQMDKFNLVTSLIALCLASLCCLITRLLPKVAELCLVGLDVHRKNPTTSMAGEATESAMVTVS